MFKNLSVGIDRRHVKPTLNTLPVNDFVSVSCNHDYAFYFPVSTDWRKTWLDCVLMERSCLLGITCFQVFSDDAFYSSDRSFQPEFSFAHNSAVITRAENVVLVVPDVVCARGLAILTLRHPPPEWGRQHPTQIGAPRIWVVPFKTKTHRSCLKSHSSPGWLTKRGDCCQHPCECYADFLPVIPHQGHDFPFGNSKLPHRGVILRESDAGRCWPKPAGLIARWLWRKLWPNPQLSSCTLLFFSSSSALALAGAAAARRAVPVSCKASLSPLLRPMPRLRLAGKCNSWPRARSIWRR